MATIGSNRDTLEHIHSQKSILKAEGEVLLPAFDLVLRRERYPRHDRIDCVCKVEGVTGEILGLARIPIFIGVDPPIELEPVQVRLEGMELSRPEGTRVNYGEAVRNLKYLVINNLSVALDMRVTVATLDPQMDNREIEGIARSDVRIGPIGIYEAEVPEVWFDENTYGVVREGKITLRCRATSLADQGGIEKWDKWVHNIILWLNKDHPGFGVFENEETFDGGSEQPRSKVRPGSTEGRWVFMLNLTHPQYEGIQEDGRPPQQYVFELMAREALYIALHAENYKPFDGGIKIGDAPHEVTREYNGALDGVLASYFEG